MDSALLRHGAKDHFFRAAICRMCQDLQDGSTAVGKYEQMCPAFTDSRECKLLKVGSSAVQFPVSHWNLTVAIVHCVCVFALWTIIAERSDSTNHHHTTCNSGCYLCLNILSIIFTPSTTTAIMISDSS